MRKEKRMSIKGDNLRLPVSIADKNQGGSTTAGYRFSVCGWYVGKMQDTCPHCGAEMRAEDSEQLFVFAVPATMVGHKFTDDVAITYAPDKVEAIAKFSRLYKDAKDAEVRKVKFGRYGVAILTDY